jgi:hypothetical protein
MACPECGYPRPEQGKAVDVFASNPAKKKPTAKTKNEEWSVGNKILIGLIILIFIALTVEINSEDKKLKQPTQFDAIVMTQIFVKRNLKSPSTAEFPSSYDFTAGEVEVPTYGKVWRVVGYVDSQNGFGAMIRTSFTCELKPIGDKWQLIDLTF